MKKFRLWCAVFFGWLFLFYNIERLHEPINIASFVYVLAALISIPVIFAVRPTLFRLRWLIPSALVLTLALKAGFGYRVTGAALPLTVTELVAVSLTVYLAHRIAMCLDQLNRSAIHSLMVHLHEKTRPFEQAQGELYREIRRARKFHRPLALVVIEPLEKSIDTALDRFTLEVQRESVKHYVRARIADLLVRNTEDCDIITQRQGRFAALLAETDKRSVQEIVRKLRERCENELGVELKFGVSVFPDDEVTFVRLLESAEAQLRHGEWLQPSGDQDDRFQSGERATEGHPAEDLQQAKPAAHRREQEPACVDQASMT